MGIVSSIMFYSAKKELSRFNGVMTWDYSQTDFSVWKIIRKDDVSANGICAALSAQWIVDHAYGGSLRNRVTDGNGKVNVGAVRMVMQNFIAAYGNQDYETGQFLLSRGMVQKRTSKDVKLYKEKRVGRRIVTTSSIQHTSSPLDDMGTSGNVALNLTAALRKVVNGYAQVDFGGTGVGHATAVWIGAQNEDACFYDPNLGEVWFQDKNDFFPWFEYFYRNSYQGFPCYFNHRWSVDHWGLAVGAEKSVYGKAVRSVAGMK